MLIGSKLGRWRLSPGRRRVSGGGPGSRLRRFGRNPARQAEAAATAARVIVRRALSLRRHWCKSKCVHRRTCTGLSQNECEMSRALIVVFLIATLSTGCTSRHSVAPTPEPPYAFTILCKTTSLYPVQMNKTQFLVQVQDKQQRPVSGATVSLELSMPGMDMGRNIVALKEIAAAPGRYTGTGRFTMSGDWQMTVSANRGALHQSQAFPTLVH